MSHILLGSSIGMRESLELVTSLVGIHFLTEAKQVESSVRANLIIHTFVINNRCD